jgi:cystathionine beta-lyase
MDLQTILVHPPCSDREPTAASSTPIYQSATFGISDDGRWDYSRSGNPTREVLETQLALLDGARSSLAYASGVSALAAAFRLVPAGGRIVCGRDVYGGTFRLLDLLSRDHGLQVTYVDTSDASAAATIAGLDPDLVFVEVPSNPLLKGTDIDELRSSIPLSALLVVDNSMLSPIRFQPLRHGADIALQSGTKLLGGHGDLTAGVLSTNDPGLAEQLKFRQNAEGTALAPFESWLLIRGLQTLPLRLERQMENTYRIVELLGTHPLVEQVFFPALEAQQGPVVSFTTGSLEASSDVVSATTLFRTTVSFGSVFSSISLPCSMSHASVPESLRDVCDLPPDLVRLAVGIEAHADLCSDLQRALDTVEAVLAR